MRWLKISFEFALNESLEYVSAPYTQNLVTKESCVSFVSQTLFWNKVFMGFCVVCLIIAAVFAYKDVVKKRLKETEELDEADYDR